jgi:hypothetical protein
VAVKSSTATASMVFVSGMTLIDRSALSNTTASCSGVRGWSVPRVKAVDSRTGAKITAGSAVAGWTATGPVSTSRVTVIETQAPSVSMDAPIRAARQALMDTAGSPTITRSA